MATKPTTLPEWASSVSADITEPALAKKQTGWVVEAPPHEFFNWWQNLVFKWMVYLDAFLADAHTWVATQTFTAATVFNGGIFTTANSTMAANLTVTGAFSAGLYIGTELHTVGGSGEPAFASGAANVTGDVKTSFYKDPSGAVHVEGTVGHASATSFGLFTLPAGFRPAGIVRAPGVSFTTNANVVLSISPTGAMTVNASAAITEVSFAFSFRPDAAIAP